MFSFRATRVFTNLLDITHSSIAQYALVHSLFYQSSFKLHLPELRKQISLIARVCNSHCSRPALNTILNIYTKCIKCIWIAIAGKISQAPAIGRTKWQLLKPMTDTAHPPSERPVVLYNSWRIQPYIPVVDCELITKITFNINFIVHTTFHTYMLFDLLDSCCLRQLKSSKIANHSLPNHRHYYLGFGALHSDL